MALTLQRRVDQVFFNSDTLCLPDDSKPALLHVLLLALRHLSDG